MVNVLCNLQERQTKKKNHSGTYTRINFIKIANQCFENRSSNMPRPCRKDL